MEQQMFIDSTKNGPLKNSILVDSVRDEQINETILHIDGSISIFSENYLHRPVSDIATLKSGLTTYLLVLTLFEDAAENFIQKRFRLFDALIGNNSCYVVAYIVFFLCTKMESDAEFQIRISNNIKKVSEFRVRLIEVLKKNDFEFNFNYRFIDFLLIKDIQIELDVDFIYLVMCFGCSLAKSKNPNHYDEIDYDQIINKYCNKTDANLSKNPVVKVIKYWQKVVSHLNVKILQLHSQCIPEEFVAWKKYISDTYILKDSHNRLCMPSLFSLKMVYHLLLTTPGSVLALQVNVVLKPKEYVGRFTIYYQIQKDGSVVSINLESLEEVKPVYLFSGCRYVSEKPNLEEIKTEFLSRKLVDIIFAHEVTYPQYPKSLKKENIIPSSELIINEIARLKKIQGCSLEDPFDFCTVHVYVDDTETQALSVYEPPVYLPNLH